ncbi:MAG: Flp family type IVb pilin [Methylocystis sp.]|nr:MAG: Flp family type IVb pilin [Methylocystis sp.]
MRMSIRRFIADRRGATAFEYALIAFMVSIVIIAGSHAIGTRLSVLYFGALIGNF